MVPLLEKHLENLITEKASQTNRNLVIVFKKCDKKNDFSFQKHEKYVKSKDYLKRPLGAFIQEILANFKFRNSEN